MPEIIIDRWKYVDPDKRPYLGHQYEKNGKMAWHKRCEYCGVWMTFDIKNMQTLGDNLRIGHNGVPEKIHCGSSGCQDYHHRVLKHEASTLNHFNKATERMYNRLKKQGLVA